MAQPDRAFRVIRPAPGELRVDFPKRLSVSSLLVLALGLAVTCLFGIPLGRTLRKGGATSRFGYGLGAGLAMTGFGVALLAGRRQVLVTDRSIVHRMRLAGIPVLTSEVAKEDVASIQAEDEGADPCIRVYPRTGSRIHIEGFASPGERDWFLAQLLIAIDDAQRAFQAKEGPSEPAGPAD